MLLKLLIIEDDLEFADYMRRGLTYDGYQIHVVHSAEDGIEEVRRRRPDLIIFDVMLPYMDGITACRRVRGAGYDGPILMLTARDAIDDRVTGLDAGADDYMVKPVEFEELLARLRALLRRYNCEGTIISYSDVRLNIDLRTALRFDTTITLTRTEFDLLYFLLSYPEQILSREILLENIWGATFEQNPNVLDIYVSRLRRKLGEPSIIHTVYGTGYILKK